MLQCTPGACEVRASESLSCCIHWLRMGLSGFCCFQAEAEGRGEAAGGSKEHGGIDETARAGLLLSAHPAR
jgi:hypothetical protein